MRTLLAVLTVAVVLWVPGKPLADDASTGMVERFQDLQLTDQQEAKIAEIVKDCQPKVQEDAKELKAVVRQELEKIDALLTPEQKVKIKAHLEERKEHRAERLAERLAHLAELELTDAELAKMKELREEYRPKVHKALESLRGLLTEQQRQAREEALKAGKNRREVLAALNLTEEQKEKVAAVGKEIAGLVREHMEKILDMLTDSQKEKLAEFAEEGRDRARDRIAHIIMNFRDLNLTEDQKAKIMEIRKEFRPKVHEAGNRLRAVVREELAKIVAVMKG
jgi:Spy/CpxP family protein refolding chaperone